MHNRFTVLNCPKWVQVNRCQCVTSGVSQILQEENVEMEVKAGTRPQRRSKVGWGMSLGIHAASSPTKGSWRGSNSVRAEESNRHVGLTKDSESQKWAFGTEADANPTDARAGLLASYFCSWMPSFFIFSLWREVHTAYPYCCTTFLSIYFIYIYILPVYLILLGCTKSNQLLCQISFTWASLLRWVVPSCPQH